MKSIIRFITISIALILIGCTASYEDRYKEIEKLQSEEKFEEAINQLDELVKDYPNDQYALLDRAVNKSAIENYSSAIEDYNKVISINPKNDLAKFNKAKNLFRLEKYKQSIVIFNRLFNKNGGGVITITYADNPYFEDDPFSVSTEEISFEKGRNNIQLENFSQAFDDFELCIQSGFALDISYYWNGYILCASGNVEDGCRYLTLSKNNGDTEAQGLIDKYCN
jgi:tetratricopeptide (TPR) repeat protein